MCFYTLALSKASKPSKEAPNSPNLQNMTYSFFDAYL